MYLCLGLQTMLSMCVYSSLGPLDTSTVVKAPKQVSEAEKMRQTLMDSRPPLDEILNLHDFEVGTGIDPPVCSHLRKLSPGSRQGRLVQESMGLLLFCVRR